MKVEQLTLDQAIDAARSRPEPPLPSFSSQVVAQNQAECPPEPTFKPSQKQLRAVYEAMKHGRWMTLAEIAFHARAPEASASARIRDLDREFGIPHERRKAKDGGLYQYRLIPNPS